MSATAITCRRTLSRARNLVTTALSVGGFLAASAALFAFRLDAAEGSHQLLSSVWAVSVAPFLPVLAALLGMDVWSDERRTLRLEMLLTVAVKESDFVIGKTLAVWLSLIVSILLSLFSTLTVLIYTAPLTLVGVKFWAFVPALLILSLQSLLWACVSVAISSMCRQAFAAAAATTVLLVALPRGLWEAAANWSTLGRTTFGEMPLDAHVVDFSSGVFSTGVFLPYVMLSLFALAVAIKTIELVRFPGRRAFSQRFGMMFSLVLAGITAVAMSVLVNRLDVSFDLPVRSLEANMPRLERVLTESSGRLTLTAFLARKDANFRPLAHNMRVLKRLAEVSGGLEVTLRFVDPRWDFGAAERLVRMGVRPSSLVCEKGNRFVAVPVEDGFGDQVLASAIQRVVLPPQRRDVYWTIGHGESAFDAYGAWGMSDIARELVRNGYRNRNLDLASMKSVPHDCALVIVAGAKSAFSRLELDRLDGYLRSGGRLLVMVNSVEESGVGAILPGWGLKIIARPIVAASTLSGTNVIVSDFDDHSICSGLEGSRLVFEHPVSFAPSAAVEAGGGADRLEFASVARVGQSSVIACVERGSTVGSDLAIRPTRLVAIGDPSFVMNGQLTARANGNRDIFLNIVSFLAGTDQLGPSGDEIETLVTGLDRPTWARFATTTVVVIPLVVFFVMAGVAIRRRRRG